MIKKEYDAIVIGGGIQGLCLGAYLQRAGTPIGNYDLLIAAHALFQGLTLVTNNTKEFKRVPDLRIENWIEPDKSSVRGQPRR